MGEMMYNLNVYLDFKTFYNWIGVGSFEKYIKAIHYKHIL